MTKRKHLKRRVRERTQKTGESYTAALRHLRKRGQEAADMPTTTETNEPDINADLMLACTFCGKSQKQVKKLIAGPGVYICDECIGLCNDILQGEGVAAEPATGERAPWLETAPIEQLLSIFAGMAHTAATMEQRLGPWATMLGRRGVTKAALANALGVSEEELAERFDL